MAIVATNVDSGAKDTAINNGGTQAHRSYAFQNIASISLTWGPRGTAPWISRR